MIKDIQLVYKGEDIEGYTVDEFGNIYSPHGTVLKISKEGVVWVKIDGCRKSIRHARAVIESHKVERRFENHISIAFKDGNPMNTSYGNMYWIPFTAFKPFEDNRILLPEEDQINIDNWREKSEYQWDKLSKEEIDNMEYIISTMDMTQFVGGYPELVWEDMRQDGWRFIPPFDIIDQYLYRRSRITSYLDYKITDYDHVGDTVQNTIFNTFGLMDQNTIDTVLSVHVNKMYTDLEVLIDMYNRSYSAEFKFPPYIGENNSDLYQHLLLKRRELDRRFSGAVRAKKRAYSSIY